MACGHVKGEKNKGGNTKRKLLFFTQVLDHSIPEKNIFRLLVILGIIEMEFSLISKESNYNQKWYIFGFQNCTDLL